MTTLGIWIYVQWLVYLKSVPPCHDQPLTNRFRHLSQWPVSGKQRGVGWGNARSSCWIKPGGCHEMLYQAYGAPPNLALPDNTRWCPFWVTVNFSKTFSFSKPKKMFRWRRIIQINISESRSTKCFNCIIQQTNLIEEQESRIRSLEVEHEESLAREGVIILMDTFKYC